MVLHSTRHSLPTAREHGYQLRLLTVIDMLLNFQVNVIIINFITFVVLPQSQHMNMVTNSLFNDIDMLRCFHFQSRGYHHQYHYICGLTTEQELGYKLVIINQY